MVKSLLRYLAFRHGLAVFLYKKWGCSSSEEWASFLKARGILHSIGDNCFINSSAVITDPQFVSLGNNVGLSSCTLICHDGTAAMLSKATGKILDRVAPIIIGDNVFIGEGAIILPGTRIGSNVIIGAGAVVTGTIPDGVVAGGVPAKELAKTDELIKKMEAVTKGYPWYPLLLQNSADHSSARDHDIHHMRLNHFFSPLKFPGEQDAEPGKTP